MSRRHVPHVNTGLQRAYFAFVRCSWRAWGHFCSECSGSRCETSDFVTVSTSERTPKCFWVQFPFCLSVFFFFPPLWSRFLSYYHILTFYVLFCFVFKCFSDMSMITHQLFLVLLAFILGWFICFALLLFPLYYRITDVLASGLLNAFFYWWISYTFVPYDALVHAGVPVMI